MLFLLLEKGADVNAQGGYYGYALQDAARGVHLDITQLLLESGANVNSQGGEYGNALQGAAVGGHHGIIDFLKNSNHPAFGQPPNGAHEGI